MDEVILVSSDSEFEENDGNDGAVGDHPDLNVSYLNSSNSKKFLSNYLGGSSSSQIQATTSKFTLSSTSDTSDLNLSDQEFEHNISMSPTSPEALEDELYVEDKVKVQQLQASRVNHPFSDSDHSDQASPVTVEKDSPKKPAKRKGSRDPDCAPSKARKKLTAEEKETAATDKEAKRCHREALRRLRPEHSLKFTVAEIDTSLLSIFELQGFQSLEPFSQIRQELNERVAPYTIGWHRELLPDCLGETKKEMAGFWLQVLEMSLLEILVLDNQLTNHVTTLVELYPRSKAAFIVLGTKQYFTREQEAKRKKNKTGITRVQLDEAIAECQVELGVTFRLLNAAQELSDWLFRYTKAVANEPFKALKQGWQSQFRFYLAAEKGKTIRVGSAGEGLSQLWLQVLRKFRRAPIEACQAIASAYPSPSSLIEAYKNCNSEEEARDLLQNVVVQRGIGPVAVQRRVGPNLSRKVHAVLTSTEPDLLLSEVAK